MQYKKIAVVVMLSIVLLGFIGKGWTEWGGKKAEIIAEKSSENQSVKEGAIKNGKDGFGKGAKPLVVSVEPVKLGEVRVYQNSLGSVTSFATVAVKSRVNGQLVKVHYREGQLVQAGQLLAQVDVRPFEAELAQVQGQHLRNQALLANAKADLDRYKVLREQDSIASQQVDAQSSLVEQFKGTVLADSGAVNQAKLQLAFTKITAPISGRIGLRQIDPGNNITTADTLAVINQVSPIAVTFTVPEDKISEIYQRLDHKQSKGLLVEAWDKGNAKKLANGKLLTLDNQIDPASGTIKLKAEFTNKEGLLFPNQFVNIKLLLNTLQQVTVLPVSGIQHGSQGTFVYIVGAGDKLRVQPVQVGPADAEKVAVLAGVALGDRVVISGIDKLRDGAKVIVADGKKFAHPSKQKNGQSSEQTFNAPHKQQRSF